MENFKRNLVFIIFITVGISLLIFINYLFYSDYSVPRHTVTVYNVNCINAGHRTDTDGELLGFALGYSITGSATGGLVGATLNSESTKKPLFTCVFSFEFGGTKYTMKRHKLDQVLLEYQPIRIKVRQDGIYPV